MHQNVIHLLRFFNYQHLPTSGLQEIGQLYSELAQKVAQASPDSAETTVAIRKLLESRDAVMRASL